jgi:hypothetical protein
MLLETVQTILTRIQGLTLLLYEAQPLSKSKKNLTSVSGDHAQELEVAPIATDNQTGASDVDVIKPASEIGKHRNISVHGCIIHGLYSGQSRMPSDDEADGAFQFAHHFVINNPTFVSQVLNSSNLGESSNRYDSDLANFARRA